MPHDGVRASVDDPMTPLGLNTHARLGKLVDGSNPGGYSHGGHKQKVADPTHPPWHGQPVKAPIDQCRHEKNGSQSREHEARPDLVPAFRKAEATSGNQ